MDLKNLDIPRVLGMAPQRYGDLYFKRYDFHTVPQGLEPETFISEALSGIYGDVIRHGLPGVAFVYGYNDSNRIIGGVDLAVYRSEPAESVIRLPDNPIIHTWTLEKELPDGSFEYLHRNRDGTFCASEGIILGKELELLLEQLDYQHDIGTAMVIERYLEKQPDVKYLMKF